MLRLDKNNRRFTSILFQLDVLFHHFCNFSREERDRGRCGNTARWKNSVDNAPRAKAETRGGNRNTIWRVRARAMESRRGKCTTSKKCETVYCAKINGEQRMEGI